MWVGIRIDLVRWQLTKNQYNPQQIEIAFYRWRDLQNR
jgi:hypothetical protein